MTKFTPEKWDCFCATNGSFYVFPEGARIVTGYPERIIAEVYPQDDDFEKAYNTARLFAGTPDLLQALRQSNKLLKATEVFMRKYGVDAANELHEFCGAVDELLGNIAEDEQVTQNQQSEVQ